MILACPACRSRFAVDPRLLGVTGRKVRCARCSHVWHAFPPESSAPPPPRLVLTPDPAEMDEFATTAVGPIPASIRPDRASISAEEAWLARRRRQRWAAWAAVAAAVLAINVSIVVLRNEIAQALPGTGGFYGAVNLDLASDRIRIVDSAAAAPKWWVEPLGGDQIRVTAIGALINTGDSLQAVPMLQAEIEAPDGRILKERFAPPVATLAPGAMREFRHSVVLSGVAPRSVFIAVTRDLAAE